ncbi:MAG: indole-3-glycerol-phosphate synthase [Candidatus Saccharicenans sp.]|nr:MAG: hypothetical protein C0168_11560 [Candidatus Aminicenantes bacterium]
MNFLEEIKKKVEAKAENSSGEIKNSKQPLSLIEYIRRKNGLIGEFKRATPTRKFYPRLSPSEMAHLYERYGFSAVSVVVEEEYFLTTKQDFADVRKAVRIPVLKKGFFLHRAQIIEAYNEGADSILLIASFVGRQRLMELLEECQRLHLEPIVEVHSLDDLEMIAVLPVQIVGINNRDLKSLRVDLFQGELILKEAKSRSIGQMHIIESGLKTVEELKKFRQLGADGFLIGGAFMEANNPEAKIKELSEEGIL